MHSLSVLFVPVSIELLKSCFTRVMVNQKSTLAINRNPDPYTMYM